MSMRLRLQILCVLEDIAKFKASTFIYIEIGFLSIVFYHVEV